ncbi:MAG TPA: hypothetical protein VER11_27315 [Polyangiaceae bacterium]|nr:hypothetical protein [Polyangiaceae bacterium]
MSACIKYVAVGFLAGALLLSSKTAAAQGASSRTGQAQGLVQQGQALIEAGDVAAACVKFEAAETLEISPVTLLRLGDCYQRVGRTASAWHAFLEAQALAQDGKKHELAQRAAERVAALEPKLSRVVFVVPMTSRVPGLTVRLGANTVPPNAWGTAIPVDPGVQRVSAAAKGYRAWSVEVDTSRGEGQRHAVNVPTLTPESDKQSRVDRGRAYRTAGIVTGSVGLAGLGAGAVFSALSRGANEASTCAKGAPCAQNPTNKASLSDAATVSFALGGALLATGVTLFVVAPSADNQEKHALRVAARYASSGGRVQLEGVW